MIILSRLEQQTIVAALRNGLGLTHACRGLHREPREVSEFIRATPAFELECHQNAIAGYQGILIAMNDAQNKKAWERWRASQSNINSFVSGLNLWESFCKRSEFNFQNVTLAMMHCKTIAETATAMGFTEIEFRTELYKDPKLIQWFIQNDHRI